MFSHVRSWLLIASLLAISAVLSACTGSSDGNEPDTAADSVDRMSEGLTMMFGELGSLGFQCVPRNAGHETPAGGRCAYVDDEETLQTISFVTTDGRVTAWTLTVVWEDDTPTDVAAVESVVRPALEKLAGVDAEQAIEVARGAVPQGPGPVLDEVTESGPVAGEVYQLAAGHGMFGFQVGGVGLSGSPDLMTVQMVTQSSATQVDLAQVNESLAGAGITCTVDDAGMGFVSLICDLPGIVLSTVSGRVDHLEVGLDPEDPQRVAALASSIEVLDNSVGGQVDFTTLLAQPANGAGSEIRVSGDLIVLVRSISSPGDNQVEILTV